MVDIQAAVQEQASVRVATHADAPRVATTLARAFFDDPAFSWVLRHDPGRLRTLERFFALSLRRFWIDQEATYTSDEGVAAAAWELPDRWKLSIGQQLRVLPALAAIVGRSAPRGLGAVTRMESGHPSEPHFYLPFVGVDPEWQGRGLGAAVLEPVLARCDREGLPAYLEASSPRNRLLYERLGFAVTEEFLIGKGSPPMWRMWRTPQQH